MRRKGDLSDVSHDEQVWYMHWLDRLDAIRECESRDPVVMDLESRRRRGTISRDERDLLVVRRHLVEVMAIRASCEAVVDASEHLDTLACTAQAKYVEDIEELRGIAMDTLADGSAMVFFRTLYDGIANEIGYVEPPRPDPPARWC